MDADNRCGPAGLWRRLANGWHRLLCRWGWRRKGLPAWGEGPPNILGICSHCGAIVLEGYHQPTPNGLLCQRCAGKKGE